MANGDFMGLLNDPSSRLSQAESFFSNPANFPVNSNGFPMMTDSFGNFLPASNQFQFQPSFTVPNTNIPGGPTPLNIGTDAVNPELFPGSSPIDPFSDLLGQFTSDPSQFMAQAGNIGGFNPMSQGDLPQGATEAFPAPDAGTFGVTPEMFPSQSDTQISPFGNPTAAQGITFPEAAQGIGQPQAAQGITFPETAQQPISGFGPGEGVTVTGGFPPDQGVTVTGQPPNPLVRGGFSASNFLGDILSGIQDQGLGGFGQPAGFFGVPGQNPLGSFGVGGQGGSFFTGSGNLSLALPGSFAGLTGGSGTPTPSSSDFTRATANRPMSPNMFSKLVNESGWGRLIGSEQQQIFNPNLGKAGRFQNIPMPKPEWTPAMQSSWNAFLANPKAFGPMIPRDPSRGIPMREPT